MLFMTNAIVKSGEGMKNIKLITMMFIILSSVFLGCVKAPVGTPTPTATPTATEIVKPTATVTLSPAPTPTPVKVQAVYRTDVDETLGFYDVRALNTTKPAPYGIINKTLTISTGDKVIWVSDSDDYTITIVSEQSLWDNSSAKLRWKYQEFNYTFTQPGIYGVYIKEFRVTHQKIIVNP